VSTPPSKEFDAAFATEAGAFAITDSTNWFNIGKKLTVMIDMSFSRILRHPESLALERGFGVLPWV
jgi:hypothetical protein